MGWREIAWAKAQPVESAADHSVLVAIAGYANGPRSAWPSVRLLCEETRLSRRTVQRTLRRLEGAGFITSTARGGTNGTRQTSNAYKLRKELSNLSASRWRPPRVTVAPLEPVKGTRKALAKADRLKATATPSDGSAAQPSKGEDAREAAAGFDALARFLHNPAAAIVEDRHHGL